MTELKNTLPPKKIFLKSGIKNVVHSKTDWKYLVFYDVDRQLTQEEFDWIDAYMKDSRLAYMIYKTNHGVHIVVLTPLTAGQWGVMFSSLSMRFKSYYSGSTLRWKLQKDETQELLVLNMTYGEPLPNLYNLFAKRFNKEKLYWSPNPTEYEQHSNKTWYGIIFEKYRSAKQ